MDDNPVLSAKTLGMAVCLMIGSEACALLFSALTPIQTLTLIRSIQIVLLLGLLAVTPCGVTLAGLSRHRLTVGLKAGVVWSFSFGGLVLGLGGMLFLAGKHPLHLVASPLPEKHMLLFFVTGGLLGPVCEELFFRGIVYTFFRRFGILCAMVLTTVLFAVLHGEGGGIVQVIGGLVFSISFERSKSLVTPMIIHVSGNLAIFSLSCYQFFFPL